VDFSFRRHSGLGRTCYWLDLSRMTQAVWKRFSYPNNSKQPGVMDLDATV